MLAKLAREWWPRRWQHRARRMEFRGDDAASRDCVAIGGKMVSQIQETVPVGVNMEHLLEIISERVFSDPYAPIREYIANARDASLNTEAPAVHVFAGGD